MQDIKQLQADIKLARQWAKDHFAKKGHPDLQSDPLSQITSTELTFPQPDEMEAWPCAFGERLGIAIFYKLSWPSDGSLVWIPRSPFSGKRMVNPVTGEHGKLVVRTSAQ